MGFLLPTVLYSSGGWVGWGGGNRYNVIPSNQRSGKNLCLGLPPPHTHTQKPFFQVFLSHAATTPPPHPPGGGSSTGDNPSPFKRAEKSDPVVLSFFLTLLRKSSGKKKQKRQEVLTGSPAPIPTHIRSSLVSVHGGREGGETVECIVAERER